MAPSRPGPAPEEAGDAGTGRVQRAERLRPLDLVGLAAAMALFTGFGVVISTREWELAGIFAVAAFIVALVVMASISITAKPDAEELADLAEQEQGPPR